jgi:O-antigen ligase
MFAQFTLETTYKYLLISLAFLLPLTVAGANTIIVIICFLWLLSGDYKEKFNIIFQSKLMIASIVFFLIHVLGLIWTEDLRWGFHMVHKMWYFIGLFPILFTLVRKDNISNYIFAFLLAISFTEIMSYLVWFEIIPPFKNATVDNPTPFMSHISYNPILAFAIYLVLHQIFFNEKLTNLVFSFYSFFAISMTINMFITGGRAGQIGFFMILSILIFQIFEKQRMKSLLIIILIIPSIFLLSYQTSDLFKKRVDMAIQESISFESINMDNGSSVGQRINYAINSWDIYKKNPFIGVGTGDFPNEYRKVNEVNSPSLPYVSNPHNMYALVLCQFGLLGLVSMLSILILQVKLSYKSPNKFIRDVGMSLPLLFLVLMLSDSYLLGHYTTLMFVFFSSFLYKDFEKS